MVGGEGSPHEKLGQKDENRCKEVALTLVPCSILMAYTLALANSYGCLVSELKRQVEKVSRAGSPGDQDPGERSRLTSASLYPFISGGAEQGLPGTARRGAELGPRRPVTAPAWLRVGAPLSDPELPPNL